MAVSAPTTLGSAANAGGGTSLGFSTSATVPSAGKIWVVVGWQGAVSLSNVSGGSLTWTIDVQGTAADGTTGTAIVWADAPAGLASGTTLTANYSATTNGRLIAGMYSTGAATGAGISPSSQNGAVTAAWTTTSTAVASGNILIGASHFSTATGSPTDTASGGNTELHDFSDAGGESLTSVYQLGTGASIAASGTWSTTGAIRSSALVYVASAAAEAHVLNAIPFIQGAGSTLSHL